MNKMTVIQLLNKIANGEEVPSKIEYRNINFLYDENNKLYIVENYNEYNDLLMELSNHKGTDLNYEVEILEEEKKIPEKLDIEQDKPGKQYYIRNEYGTKCGLTQHSRMIAETLNQVIDYLKSKGDE